MERLRVAIVGAGQRAGYLYCPLVQQLRDDLELVGIYGRRLESATALGSKHGVAAFDDLDLMVRSAKPDLLIVSVGSRSNGQVGRQAAAYGGNGDADLINVLASVREADVALIFVERPGGMVKISWRSAPGIDVSRLAAQFGGGGHAPAAGADVAGTLPEVEARVVAATQAMLRDNSPAGA